MTVEQQALLDELRAQGKRFAAAIVAAENAGLGPDTILPVLIELAKGAGFLDGGFALPSLPKLPRLPFRKS